MKRLVFILLILGTVCQAQTFNTRLYFSSTATPAIAPAYGSSQRAWNVQPLFRRMMTVSPTKDGSAMTTFTSDPVGATGARFTGIIQLHSPPLQAQTITAGTTDYFRFQTRVALNGAGTNTAMIYLMIKVVSADGLTERGVICRGALGGGTVATTTLKNDGSAGTNYRIRDFQAVAGTNVTCFAGDILIGEYGWYQSSGTTTTRTGSVSIGSNNGTDLPENGTTTTANDPWLSFTQAILFQSPPPVATGNAMMLSSD